MTAGNEETLTSAATAEVEPRPNRPAVGAPTVNGAARVGKVVTADTSGITDEDRVDQRCLHLPVGPGRRRRFNARQTSPTQQASAYTLVDADEGKTVKVKVSFTDDVGKRGNSDQRGDRDRSASP